MRVTSRKAWSAAATLLLAGGGARVASGQNATAKSVGVSASASALVAPPAGVRLELTPAAEGPWHLALRNEGPVGVRLLADARLLWLEVVDAPSEPDPDAKKPAKPHFYVRGKLPICRAPAELRPDHEIAQRVLLLRPGESYEEDIDPMILCGAGKTMAALRPGALVYPHYGYAPPTGKTKPGALPPPPYVVDSLREPRDLRPARSLDGDGGVYFSDYVPRPAPAASLSAPGPMQPPPPVASAPPGMTIPAPTSSAMASAAMVSSAMVSSAMASPAMASSAVPVSSGAPAVVGADGRRREVPAGTTPAPLVDGRGPRLNVRSTALVDASSATEVTVTVTLRNEGQRSALMHFRGDDVSFTVRTPTGDTVRCDPGGGARGAVRDFFETLAPGRRHSVTLRLYELCPVATFQRPGVYSLLAEVELAEDGDAYSLPATVALVKAEAPTRLRVRTGREPYHRSPPAVVPAPGASGEPR